MTVARDALGVRPFHLARTTDGLLLGASQLAGPAELESVERIDVLPPGHVAVLEDGKVVDIRRHSSLLAPDGLPDGSPDGPGADAASLPTTADPYARLRTALADAVRARVPAGEYVLLLSGGMDSPPC
ncbi:hypothetical protein [Streptomyces hiroshimensis]|uniref:Glutamine amidotransferase type-2 domain-containing protein n=1 Tax=Streptomyces hiroshimensis TaxID=66424 RepID=A0ABQ2YMR9_9ACTN|nr:hypothetical protein [Streptomyces hiroshimensis]GGX87152.1 hypothetical protein GCM10010324_35810 [Streptomyces hiroshimensis]